MDIQALLDELYAMTFFGVKPGLERITALCEAADNPQYHLPVIHVAGTNGKGSVCAMLTAIFRAAGYRTGVYTSPHIRHFNERIRIDGVPISDEDIARLARPLMDVAKPIGGTFFEVTTAMAFRLFAERHVDVAIIETGLGGRLDATNIVHPLLSIITSIDYDHMEYLGNSLEDIAREKAGIIKPDVAVVIGERRPELRYVFAEVATRLHAPLDIAHDRLHVDVDAWHPDFTMTVSVIDETFRDYYTTDLCGQHQAENIATVMAAVGQLSSTFFLEHRHVREGLRNVKGLGSLRGRMEPLQTSPLLLLDVGHNPAGCRALVDTLRRCGYESVNVVLGAMADKDVDGMVRALAPVTSAFHISAPAFPRAMATSELATVVRQHHMNVIEHPSLAAALDASRHTDTVCCGSFHVADEILAAMEKESSR